MSENYTTSETTNGKNTEDQQPPLNRRTLREIEPMTDSKYFQDRLDSQINWYNAKSSLNQKQYKKYKTLELILAASIPVFISFSTMSIMETEIFAKFPFSLLLQIIASIAGVILVIINKLIELEEYFKNWKTYRTTCEALQQERIKYLTLCDPYDKEEAFNYLVDKIEAILNNENQKWRMVAKPKSNPIVERAEEAVYNKQLFNTTSSTIDTNLTSDTKTENTSEMVNESITETVNESVVETETIVENNVSENTTETDQTTQTESEDGPKG